MLARTPSRPYLILLLTLSVIGCEPGATPATNPEPTAVQDPPAWLDGTVIYELFVPDFTEEGTFQAIIPRLPELRALGVNTIWLMPIHPIGEVGRKGVLGSPYAIRDYYAVNPEYGTEDDFRALVEATHAADMRLIIDFVANHTAPDNAWVADHPTWYTQDAEGNPIVPAGTDWTDTRELNYDNPALRAEMINVLRHWVETYNIDGYRCDVAGLVPSSFWAEAIDSLRAVKPVLMLAEHGEVDIHEVGFDLTYGWPEYSALKEVWTGAPVSAFTEVVHDVDAALPAGTGRLRFTTNHDETAWDAPPPALFGGQEGARAAYVLMASLPGVPLVYNGQEVGIEATVPFFEQTPYDWSVRPEVQAFYAQYLEVHAQSNALRRGALTLLPGSEDVVLFERTVDAERVVVAVNVRDAPSRVTVPQSLQGAQGQALLAGVTTTLGETLTLPPFGTLVLDVTPAS
ncbi:MAG: alpha-amylase family glycosyl hydrolase [Bacteroidota bacterium]